MAEENGILSSVNANILLCGFMCAGKTSLGRFLAGRLGWKFFDTDLEFEKQKGISVSKFILQNGFTYFRKEELKIFKKTLLEKNAVIACGGGLFPSKKLLPLFNKNFSIFIDLPEHILLKRLQNTNEIRPKLMDKANIQLSVHKLLAHRLPFYKNCAFILKAENKELKALADEIMALLARKKERK